MARDPESTTTIELVPSWEDTARMLCAALDGGTEEGKRIARAELVKMGRTLDRLRVEFGKLESDLAMAKRIPAREAESQAPIREPGTDTE